MEKLASKQKSAPLPQRKLSATQIKFSGSKWLRMCITYMYMYYYSYCVWGLVEQRESHTKANEKSTVSVDLTIL